MPVLKNVLGLDLGSHSLKAVELRQTFRGLEAVQLRSLPRAGEDALTDLVRRFLAVHRLPSDHVVVALPGGRLSSRRLSLPVADRRKLAQAVPFAVEEDLPFDLEDVVVDWTAVGGDHGRTDVIAAVAPRSEVSALLGKLREAGCPPRTIEAEGLCLGNLPAVFDLPGRRLLADLGHEKSTFCLLVDERAVAARTVPIGGRHVTEALASDRGLSFEEAEAVKCEEGVLGAAGAPPQTEKVLDRLVRELLRTVGGADEALGGPLDEITIFGGTSLLGGIDGYLAERTGIPTTRLGLPRPGQHEGLVAGGPPVLFAPAIALALRGTARGLTRMNFLRDEFAVRFDLGRALRPFRSTLRIGAVALVLALASFATTTWLDARRGAAIEKEVARLYPGETLPEDPVRALREQVASAQDRADFLGVYRGNLSALDLLTEISRLVPSDLDIALEELTIDRQTVRMQVRAKSFQATDQLAVELGRFPPFRSARIGAVDTDPKTGAKRFPVTISLAPPEGRE